MLVEYGRGCLSLSFIIKNKNQVMGLHIFVTWVVTNLVHPFVFAIWISNGAVSEWPGFAEVFGGLVQIFLYSLILSLPGQLFSQLIMYAGKRLVQNHTILYIFWLLAAPLMVVLNFCFDAFVLTGGEFFLEEIEITIPAIIAVIITILLRYRQFFNACNKTWPKEESFSFSDNADNS